MSSGHIWRPFCPSLASMVNLLTDLRLFIIVPQTRIKLPGCNSKYFALGRGTFPPFVCFGNWTTSPLHFLQTLILKDMLKVTNNSTKLIRGWCTLVYNWPPNLPPQPSYYLRHLLSPYRIRSKSIKMYSFTYQSPSALSPYWIPSKLNLNSLGAWALYNTWGFN